MGCCYMDELIDNEKPDSLSSYAANCIHLKAETSVQCEPVSSSTETNFRTLYKYLGLTGSQRAGFIDWCSAGVTSGDPNKDCLLSK